MSVVALAAAIGASVSWAAGAMIAHAPARRLGAFEFTRTQLISASAVLIGMVSARGAWSSVSWQDWPGFATSSLVGVLLGNLAMIGCLRRGGPRRTQLLTAMAAPIATVLGFFVLGETLSLSKLVGAAVMLAGIGLAILYGQGRESEAEPRYGSLAGVLILGLTAATCQAVGLIALKPALLAGTDPLAASALRTFGGAAAITLLALWPARMFEAASARTGRLVASAILPGLLGYVVAVSLMLYALRSHEAGIVALCGSLSPVLMLPMIWFTTRRSPPWQAWAGACLVVLGLSFAALG
jgi:drug/metabolite transporter (DMT)-like permease